MIFFDGNIWIITRRKKNNTESNIRMLGVPRRIKEKYKRQDKRRESIFLMPSNMTCNKKLKIITELCGIKSHLTYHAARHLVATTILLSNEVPIETVSGLLVHTNIKTIQIYTNITAQKISQDIEQLSEKWEIWRKTFVNQYENYRQSVTYFLASSLSCTNFIESEKVRRLCRFGLNLPPSEGIQSENLFPSRMYNGR